MTVSKKQQQHVAKYVKNNYDSINVRVKKGDREVISLHAKNKGMSVNQYIKNLIYDDIGLTEK